jgi:hypothetical protein
MAHGPLIGEMLQNIKELLGIDPEDFNWEDFAICRGTDTNMFYEIYESDEQVAKIIDAMCLSCPVMAQCLNKGVEGDEWGTWGAVNLVNGKPDPVKNAHKTPEVWEEIKERIGGQSIF